MKNYIYRVEVVVYKIAEDDIDEVEATPVIEEELRTFDDEVLMNDFVRGLIAVACVPS